MHTAPYFTAFGLMTLVLSWRVVRLRRKYWISVGHGEKKDLELQGRVFGNFAEYVPIGLLFLIALEVVQAPVWYMHLTGASLLVGRIFHAMGLEKSNLTYRTIGVLATYFSILIGSIGVTLFTLFGFV